MKSILRKSSTPILPEVSISSEIHEQEKSAYLCSFSYRAILITKANFGSQPSANFLYQMAKDLYINIIMNAGFSMQKQTN